MIPDIPSANIRDMILASNRRNVFRFIAGGSHVQG